jgi:hypothetical protein
MKKTIIGIYGRANEGKSETIRNIATVFEASYHPAAVVNYLIKGVDILATVDFKGHRIGLEAQGDPGSRIITKRTIEELATTHNCDIIVCATRTDGATVKEVDRVANLYGFDTIWRSTYYTPGLNKTEANLIAAEEILQLIMYVIAGRL